MPFAYVMIVLLLNLTHQSHAVLEADLIGNSHLIGDGIAYTVEYLVEYINLLLVQRIFKGDTELVKLVRKLGDVNIALPIVVQRNNHFSIALFAVYTEFGIDS